MDMIEGVGDDFSTIEDNNEPQIANTIQEMLMREVQMRRSVDEIRDNYLFFNQIVVPYKETEGYVAPTFCEDGSIDTSSIKSVGIRIKCLDCAMHCSQREELFPCKNDLYRRKKDGVENNICDGDCQEPIEWKNSNLYIKTENNEKR